MKRSIQKEARMLKKLLEALFKRGEGIQHAEEALLLALLTLAALAAYRPLSERVVDIFGAAVDKLLDAIA